MSEQKRKHRDAERPAGLESGDGGNADHDGGRPGWVAHLNSRARALRSIAREARDTADYFDREAEGVERRAEEASQAGEG